MRNARCVATGDPPFFINSSTIKTRCSPNHAMVYIENGTYTAVRRRAPHHCTRFPPEAIPLPNRGVLSAAFCSCSLLGIFNQNYDAQNYEYNIRGYVWCVKDKFRKRKGMLKTAVQNETVSKTDQNFKPYLTGMEVKVQLDNAGKEIEKTCHCLWLYIQFVRKICQTFRRNCLIW